VPIDFACPHCGNRTLVADQYAGQTGPCARCGQMITVPQAGAMSPAGMPQAMAPPMGPQMPPPGMPPAPPAGKSKLGLILGIIAVVVLLCGGGIAGLGWWAFSKMQEAADRSRAQSSLHLVGIAMHDYESTYQALPAHASYGTDGKPLLSWRVHLLPYLGQSYLYDQFHFDEPWDSPHNKQLVAQMPWEYESPGADRSQGLTRFVVPVGNGTIFPPLGAGALQNPDAQRGRGTVSMSHLVNSDGSSNTIMVIQVPPEQAVIWTKPDDWQYTPQSLDGLVEYLKSGERLNVLMGDASTRTLDKTLDRENFRRLLEWNDGEPVSWFGY
jgi:hypothetical protein